MADRARDEYEAYERKMDNLIGDLKPLLPYFDDRAVTDIYVYDDGRVQVNRFAKGISDTGVILSTVDRLRIIHSLASVSETPIDKSRRPTLESIVPMYNLRVTAIIDPWLAYPQMTFRRPAERVYTLEDYRTQKRITEKLYEKVYEAIARRQNIIVSGSTGSGKTTFTNAVIAKMADLTPEDRFYIVEDTPELQCAARNVTKLYIRKDQAVAAIQTALRWTPNRIIFGELRSGEVTLELLEAWNTGHPGNVTTVHADSAVSTITRIEGLLRQVIAGTLPDIGDVVQVVVHLTTRAGFGPIVDEVVSVAEILASRRAAMPP